jgi:hypothetical protein
MRRPFDFVDQQKYIFSTVTIRDTQMATFTKTPAGTWKAMIRMKGWPTTSKTFRTKRDAEDWSRRTEDEMVRGVFIQRSASECLLFEFTVI